MLQACICTKRSQMGQQSSLYISRNARAIQLSYITQTITKQWFMYINEDYLRSIQFLCRFRNLQIWTFFWIWVGGWVCSDLGVGGFVQHKSEHCSDLQIFAENRFLPIIYTVIWQEIQGSQLENHPPAHKLKYDIAYTFQSSSNFPLYT